MAAVVFVLTGLGLAVLAGLIGIVVVAAVEILIALHDPVRKRLIQSRSWRENLSAMLH